MNAIAGVARPGCVGPVD